MRVIEPLRITKEHSHSEQLGFPEFLPPYWIATEFISSPCSGGHASGLVVIWFQAEPFPIPSKAALKQLRGITWESVARDFEY